MKKSKPIDLEIERVVGILSETNPAHKRYSIVVENLRILCEARSKEPKGLRIDSNVFIQVIGQILVTGMVLHHERLNVITTRVGAFWRKV